MSFSRLIYPTLRRSLAQNQRRMASIFEIQSDDDFSSKVLGSSEPVAVQFYADWCGPCRQLAPRLESKIEGRGGGISLAKVNIDEQADLAGDYGVTAVPTVKFFKDGEIIGSFSGNVPDDQLDQMLDEATNL